MKQLRISPRAQDDLDQIWEFVAADKPIAATRFISRLHKRLQLLAKQPELGEMRDDLRPGLRLFTVGAYAVIYRLDVEELMIIRVIHSVRDFPERL